MNIDKIAPATEHYPHGMPDESEREPAAEPETPHVWHEGECAVCGYTPDDPEGKLPCAGASGQAEPRNTEAASGGEDAKVLQADQHPKGDGSAPSSPKATEACTCGDNDGCGSGRPTVWDCPVHWPLSTEAAAGEWTPEMICEIAKTRPNIDRLTWIGAKNLAFAINAALRAQHVESLEAATLAFDAAMRGEKREDA